MTRRRLMALLLHRPCQYEEWHQGVRFSCQLHDAHPDDHILRGYWFGQQFADRCASLRPKS